ncbi:group 1 glycosyl transferase [Salinisphaera dokdonensis CL-ES53]|uniref:Group 1 glycosyl transferase n=1 Tax=Salinisphaera dokdonensis CL-ES53 TaxID=1304272 RepID=A0ABV2B478_9GAMM
MKDLLFLSHRIPYPPNKGDKIRSFHWLKALGQRYRVHLGTFVDDPADLVHESALAEYCEELCVRRLDPRMARFRSSRALLSGKPLSFAYYRDRGLRRWVKRIMAERSIDTVLVFSSPMATYIDRNLSCRRVIDFVDVDSEKWREYAATRRGPAHWLFAREARTLLAAERALSREFDASLFVSEAEKALFDERAPDSRARTRAVGNGVDTDYFDPGLDYANPYPAGSAPQLVFTGVMDYAPNVEAVQWFVAEVLPRVREQQPGASFWIVGTRPTRDVLALARVDGVQVTGSVPDVRPYLRHADIGVAPMRIARGVQNKVLEALAMGCPVALTDAAATGLRVMDDDYAGVADTAAGLADQILRLTRVRAEREGHESFARARAYTTAHYGWASQFERLLETLEDRSTTGAGHVGGAPAAQEAFACARHS